MAQPRIIRVRASSEPSSKGFASSSSSSLSSISYDSATLPGSGLEVTTKRRKIKGFRFDSTTLPGSKSLKSSHDFYHSHVHSAHTAHQSIIFIDYHHFARITIHQKNMNHLSTSKKLFMIHKKASHFICTVFTYISNNRTHYNRFVLL